MNVAARLVSLLEAYGTTCVFGLPGNHTLPLYAALAGSSLTHIGARHEQGVVFMADGHARASGRTAVAWLIGGPGLGNAATAIGQARADSVPLVIIAAAPALRTAGLGHGQLHEAADQGQLAAGVAADSHEIRHPEQLDEVLAQAFGRQRSGRPGPVVIGVPVDLLDAPASSAPADAAALPAPPAPNPAALAAAATLAASARQGLLIAGGGAAAASAEITRLAEHLQWPLLNTVNGKGVLAGDHPLAVGGSPSLPALRSALEGADVLLAFGTEFGETDYDLLMTGAPQPRGALLRVDIDPQQLLRNVRARVPVLGTSMLAARALRSALPAAARGAGHQRAAGLRGAVRADRYCNPDYQQVLDTMVRALPTAIIVGDSTQPTYHAAWQLERPAPRRYWHSASGFGTLGYALPAALGACLARPDLPVIALIGDGGLQFTLAELAAGVAAGLPVAVVVWNNDGYREIDNSMAARGIEPVGTRLPAPDLPGVARALGAQAVRVRDPATLDAALRSAPAAGVPTLIELRQADFVRTETSWYGA